MDNATAFFEAHTARSRCDAGVFVLMGRALRPLSALRLTVVETLLGPHHLFDAGLDLADFDILSRVLSEPHCTGIIPAVNASQAAAEVAQWEAAGFTPAEQRAVLDAYLLACYTSAPRMVESNPITATRADTKLPLPAFLVSSILAHSHGLTRAELWEEVPFSELCWIFEGMREQRDGHSHIKGDGGDGIHTPEQCARVDAILAAEAEAIIAAEGDEDKIAAAKATTEAALAAIDEPALAAAEEVAP
jgi:hypothetical protein